MKISWRENLIIGTLAFVIYFLLGAYIDFYRGYLPGDALSRLVSAWLVSHGTEIRLTSIGFIWPPIPNLLLIPWALIPGLFHNWLAVVIVSALSMALACIVLGYIADACGVSQWWRRLIILLFAINPLVIVFAINGMSEAILVAATFAACYWLIRFWQTERNTHLIFAAALFSLLPLIRYEFAVVSAWSGVLVLLLCWEKRRLFSKEKFSQFLEGQLLAYSSLVIYPIFLWAIANWFIMGSPTYFLANDRTATNLAGYQLADVIATPQNSFRIVFGIWFWAFPLELIASLALIILGAWKKSNFLIAFGFMPLIVPFVQFVLLTRRQSVPLLRYFMMDVPLGVIVALVFAAVFIPTIKRFRWRTTLFNVFFLLLIAFSNITTIGQLQTYPYQTFEGATWRALTSNDDARDQNVMQAYQLGELLVRTLPKNSKVLMDTYGYGFAVLLGANNHSIFMDFTDPNYNKALLNPPAYVDYILLPKPAGRDSLYAINMYQKTLYSEGAPWAELVGIIPPTIDGWRLYKIKKAGVGLE